MNSNKKIKIIKDKPKMKTDKEKVIEKFNLQEGDNIKLGECRGGHIIKIMELKDKSIKVDTYGGVRLYYRNIVRSNYEDIEKNLGK